MPLNIKDPRTDSLVRELAQATGETITQAVEVAVNVIAVPRSCGDALSEVSPALVQGVTEVMKAPTVNDHVYGTLFTVSATTYLTPFWSGACGTTITPPRPVRLPPTEGTVESMMQCASGTPLPVNEWTGLAVVATLPPTSIKTGSPVGAV